VHRSVEFGSRAGTEENVAAVEGLSRADDPVIAVLTPCTCTESIFATQTCGTTQLCGISAARGLSIVGL
jgi:hypothetical protein